MENMLGDTQNYEILARTLINGVINKLKELLKRGRKRDYISETKYWYLNTLKSYLMQSYLVHTGFQKHIKQIA